jgi:hypothetical protein
MRKVIAKSGSAFLIQFEDGSGRVLDLDQDRLFPPNSVDSILARGYWEPFTGDPAPVLDQIAEKEGDGLSALNSPLRQEGPVAARSRSV